MGRDHDGPACGKYTTEIVVFPFLSIARRVPGYKEAEAAETRGVSKDGKSQEPKPIAPHGGMCAAANCGRVLDTGGGSDFTEVAVEVKEFTF